VAKVALVFLLACVLGATAQTKVKVGIYTESL